MSNIFNDILNFISLYLDHLKSTKKSIMVVIIGFIVLLSVISSSMIFVDFVSPTVYPTMVHKLKTPTVENFTRDDFKPYPFDVDIQTSMMVNENNLINYIRDVNQTILSSEKDSNLTFSNSAFYYYLNGFTMNLNYTNQQGIVSYKTTPVLIYEITPRIKPELELLLKSSGIGTFPSQSSPSEVLLFHFKQPNSRYVPDLDNNSNLSVTFLPEGSSSNKSQVLNAGINITSFIETNTISNQTYPNLMETILNSYFSLEMRRADPNTPILFVPNLKNFLSDVISPLHPSNTGFRYYYYCVLNVHAGLNLNFSKLNPFNSVSDSIKIEDFSNQMKIQIDTNVGNNFETFVNFQSQPIFAQVTNQLNTYLAIMICFAIPIIAIAFIVLEYCFGLTDRNLINLVRMYNDRGLKNKFILTFEIGNLVIIGVISSLLSIIPGYISALFISSSAGLLNFGSYQFLPIIPDLTSIFLSLLEISLLFCLLIAITHTFKLIKIINSEEVGMYAQFWKPFWKRSNFDLWLLSLGGLGTIFSYVSLVEKTNFIGVARILFYPSIFLLLVSLLLTSYGLIPSILTKTSDFLWKRMTGLLSLSFKELVRNKKTTTRAIMVIGIITTTFIILTTGVVSYNTNLNSSLEYNTGAEGVALYTNVNNTYFINNTFQEEFQQNYNNYVADTSPFLKLSAYTNGGYVDDFLAINTTKFLSTALFPINPKTTNTLHQDMVSLAESNAKNNLINIIINKDFLKTRHLQIGEKFTLYSGTLFSGTLRSITFNIIDSYQNWPGLYQGETNSAFGVIDYNHFLVKNYTFENSFFTLVDSGLSMKFKPGIDIQTFANTVQTESTIQLSIIKMEYHTAVHDPNYLFVIGQINEDIIFSICLMVLIFVLLVVRQFLTRKQEIMIEISLGVKSHQLFLQFLVESVVILSLGLLLGIILGVLFSEAIGLYFTFQNELNDVPASIPSFKVIYPFQILLPFFLISIILVVLSVALTILFEMRKELIGMLSNGDI